jgi:hypothetical protein
MSSDEDYSPSLGREIHSSLPEHEILLSFNSDWMAEAFDEWWALAGHVAWLEWVKKNGLTFRSGEFQ